MFNLKSILPKCLISWASPPPPPERREEGYVSTIIFYEDFYKAEEIIKI